jgi:hypothetical protein
MPHATDGVLHAYLDGALAALERAGELPDGASAADVVAHLDVCADCRARLDQERALRTAAGLVLADAASTFEVPPFEEVARRPAQPRRQRRWVVPAAWVASVLLALGSGWWAGASLLSPGRNTFVQATDAGQATGAEPALGVRLPAGLPAPAEPGAAAAPPQSGAVAAAPTAAPAGPAAVTAYAAQAAAVTAGEPLGQPAAPAVVAADAAQAATATADRPLGEPAARLESLAAATAAAARSAREQRPLAAAPPPPAVKLLPETAGAPARAIPPAAGKYPDDRSADALLGWAVRLATETADWVAVDGATAPGGVPVLVIDGAGAPSAAYRPVIGTAGVVRVRQQLGDGSTVELVSWRPQALALSEVVVTAAGADRRGGPPPQAAAALPEAGAAAAPSPPQLLAATGAAGAAGESRVLLFLPDRGMYVLLRGAQPADRLADVGRKLAERR